MQMTMTTSDVFQHYVVTTAPSRNPITRHTLASWLGLDLADIHYHHHPHEQQEDPSYPYHAFVIFSTESQIEKHLPPEVLQHIAPLPREQRRPKGRLCPAETLVLIRSTAPKRKYISMTTADPHECEAIVTDLLDTDPSIRWVHRQPNFRAKNAIATWTMQQRDTPLSRPLWTQWNLTGKGQLVAVGDTGLDYMSCFFRDDSEEVVFYPKTNINHRKIHSYIECVDPQGVRDHADVYAGHGTHVSGSVAGYMTNRTMINSDFSGMAPDARIIFTDLVCGGNNSEKFVLPNDLSEYFLHPYLAGARVSSNSWGSDETPRHYTTIERETDAFAYAHPDHLIVFAAGNDQSAGIRSPAMCKNVLTVGAHFNTDADGRESMATYSSTGPTYDKRIKPDLVAPGQSVMSAQSAGVGGTPSCNLESKGGSSMATPFVAGAALLARQYLQRDLGQQSPSSALLRAFLLQGTSRMVGQDPFGKPLGPTVPDNFQGWGRLELPPSILFNRSVTSVVDNTKGVSHGEQVAVRVRVAESLSNFRVSLSWTDPPSAAEGSLQSLVNHLDVALVDDRTGSVLAKTNATKRYGNLLHLTVPRREGLSVVRVVVFGARVIDGISCGVDRFAQPYALVMSGTVMTTDLPVSTQCPDQCSGHGQCHDEGPVCHCQPGWRNVDCAECDSAVMCSQRGICLPTSPLPTCVCPSTTRGEHCEACQEGMAGPLCMYTIPMCQYGRWEGATSLRTRCVCHSDNVEGVLCDRCKRDRRGYPKCQTVSSWCVSGPQIRQIDSSAGEEGIIQIGPEGKNYTPSLNCSWRLSSSDPTVRFLFYFSFFYVEAPGDRLTLYTSKGTRQDFTGSPVDSKSNVVTVTFQSDLFGTERGFLLHWKAEGGSSVHKELLPITSSAGSLSRTEILISVVGTGLLFVSCLTVFRLWRRPWKRPSVS